MQLTVETEIELFASDQKGIIDVAGDDIGFVHVKSLESCIEVGARDDLFKLVYLFEEEDAIALRFVVGLDDPSRVWIFLKLIQENSIFICLRGWVLGKVKVIGKKSMCTPGPPHI